MESELFSTTTRPIRFLSRKNAASSNTVTMDAFFTTMLRCMGSSITFLSSKISIVCLRPLLISTLVKLKPDTCYGAKIILWVHDVAVLKHFCLFLLVEDAWRAQRHVAEAFREWLALLYCLCIEKSGRITSPDEECHSISNTTWEHLTIQFYRLARKLALSSIIAVNLACGPRLHLGY